MTAYQLLHDPLLDSVLLASDEIEDICQDLGGRITRDYTGHDLVLVTVLRGGLVFLADLCRRIDLPVTLDFMAISSYSSGAAVRITKDLDDAITRRDVLVVEDIVDTGLTLNYLLGVLKSRNPASLGVCALLDRDARRLADIPIAYRGLKMPDRFVVGYGLDLGGRYRNLPYIATVRDEVMG
ncbi:MAG: hypoxanthine phosphoribosyltransferase [Coriobacteriales bacterium]|nr:hypoxanthine phosphoribosyltransferase [Actinomycetes bacterium]